MKTTVEIPSSLFQEVKRCAAREGTTVKSLLLEGLRQALTKHKKRASFHLRKASFKGRGIQPSLSNQPWEKIRDLVYEGRGG